MAEPAAWGIQEDYLDYRGNRWAPSRGAIDALLQAMGAGDDAPPASSVTFVRAGDRVKLRRPVELHAEDGGVLTIDEIPPDLPCGYHRLIDLDGGRATRVIVTPGRCFLPAELQTWGWAVQLYALRSRASWGMGDLADLRRLARWSRDSGAEVAIVNPLHAVAPTLPQQPSPYYPSSRCWRNPLYLRIEELPGAAELGADLDALARAGRALNRDRRIDRDEIFRLKMEALQLLWERSRGSARFECYVARCGHSLEGFATFAALAERHGSSYHAWPRAYRHPASPAVARWREEHVQRVHFHAWVQWLIDIQLERASSSLGVVHDLAIGVAPGGADAWLWQDAFAAGASVGAPPDEFNNRGQDWGIRAFDPWRLRALEYEPFIQTVRAALRHAGGLRIDHVMGLWRLYWIPRGAGPTDGAYVRYPSADLLDIVALESQRARAFIVGEDLGTVEANVRDELAARRMLSYRLLWFEGGDVSRFPRISMAAVTNHDLPTVAGLWTRADIEAQRRIGLTPDEDSAEDVRARLRDRLNVDEDASVDEVVEASYRLLGSAPSAVVCGLLEDALGVVERANQPGTINEWPNWSLALPRPLEDVEQHATARAIAASLTRRRAL